MKNEQLYTIAFFNPDTWEYSHTHKNKTTGQPYLYDKHDPKNSEQYDFKEEKEAGLVAVRIPIITKDT
jgi:hypothetical protein